MITKNYNCLTKTNTFNKEIKFNDYIITEDVINLTFRCISSLISHYLLCYEQLKSCLLNQRFITENDGNK